LDVEITNLEEGRERERENKRDHSSQTVGWMKIH
jgi:hypothetical protein